MIGHSHRAGSVVNAGRWLPFFSGTEAARLRTDRSRGGWRYQQVIPLIVLVLGGTLDTLQGRRPTDSVCRERVPQDMGADPRANHFGYTDLVSPDNMAVCNCAGARSI